MQQVARLTSRSRRAPWKDSLYPEWRTAPLLAPFLRCPKSASDRPPDVRRFEITGSSIAPDGETQEARKTDRLSVGLSIENSALLHCDRKPGQLTTQAPTASYHFFEALVEKQEAEWPEILRCARQWMVHAGVLQLARVHCEPTVLTSSTWGFSS